MAENDASEVKFHINLITEHAIKPSGLLGRHHYENGRSVEPLTLHEAMRIGGSCEAVDDDGVQINIANYNALADKHRVVVIEPVVVEPEVVEPVVVEPAVVEPTTILRVYTQQELEEIADKKGIAGLREIADLLNVKGRSIPEMISLIVHKQRNS